MRRRTLALGAALDEEDDDDEEEDDDEDFRGGELEPSWEGLVDTWQKAAWEADQYGSAADEEDADEEDTDDEAATVNDDTDEDEDYEAAANDALVALLQEKMLEEEVAAQKEDEMAVRRAELEAKGLTAAQISAVLGTAEAEAAAAQRKEAVAMMTEVYAPPKEATPPPVEIEVETFIETVAPAEELEMEGPDGTDSSHKFVELDDSGEPLQARFVYVDEYSCVGCTLCTGVATNTFMMEEEYGRARVFNQEGDDLEIVAEAIGTCPVDCIHFVSWEDLIAQEVARDSPNRGAMNFKARLVGGETQETMRAYDKGAGGGSGGWEMPALPGNSGARCNNCPGNGCKVCPMFGVGENPIYVKRKLKIDQKRKARKAQKAAAENGATSADL